MYSILAAPDYKVFIFFYKKIFLQLARFGIAFIFKTFKNAKFFSRYKNKTHLPKRGVFSQKAESPQRHGKDRIYRNIERAQGFYSGKFPFFNGLFGFNKKNIPFNAKRSLKNKKKTLTRYSRPA